MILVSSKGSLLLVRQPEHAAMSARIASSWPRPGRLPAAVWPRFLEGVRRHDDGWIGEEERPSLDPLGRPYDFKSLPEPLHVAIWQRGVELVGRDDPYQGILVAQHARWLYEDLAGKAGAGGAASAHEQAAASFIGGLDRAMEEMRLRLLAGSGEESQAAAPEALLLTRRLLSFFDGISLKLLGAIPMKRSEPLAFGEREKALTLKEAWNGTQIVPWPFETSAVPVEVTAVRVGSGPFASPEDLASAMRRGREERLGFELVE